MRVATRISRDLARRRTLRSSVVHPLKAVMHRFGVPLALAIAATAILLGYALSLVLGWRDYVAVVSGTFASEDHNLDMVRCVAFLGFYFGAVVVAPILLIAAPVWSLLDAYLLRRRSSRSDS